MHEQGKMNMIMFEQLQAMNEKLARFVVGDASGTSNQADKAKLPSQPINPHEEVKAIHILRSGTQYSGPDMPEETAQPAGTLSQPACGPHATSCASQGIVKSGPQATSCGPQGVNQGTSAGSSAVNSPANSTGALSDISCGPQGSSCAPQEVVDELSTQDRMLATSEDYLAARKPPIELNKGEAVFAVHISTDGPKRTLCESHEISADRTPSLADARKPEPKPPPANLRYEFFDFDRSSPVILSTHSSPDKTSRVLEKLRIHEGAIRYSIEELKGLNPAICAHCIHLEKSRKPSVQHRR
jgi:hypothetical protein